MELRKNLSILDLSLKEEKVLLAIIKGFGTPLSIASDTKVTRPAVYDILTKLKKRGLVKSYIINRKKSWVLARKEDIDTEIYETKKVLFSLAEGVEEVKGLSDGTVVVHKGKEAVASLIASIANNHKDERLYSFQGNKMQTGWDRFIGQEKINEFNKNIKKNRILTEAIIPNGWFEDNMKTLGEKDKIEWAQGFINRAMGTYMIDKKYFNSAGQIFMFKSSLYLISMNEALIIEVRHSELQTLIKGLFLFITDHSRIVDVNRLLQDKLMHTVHK